MEQETKRSEDFPESLRRAKTLGQMVDLSTRARDAGYNHTFFKTDFDKKLAKMLGAEEK
jgi:hypothetical protein